MDGLGRMRTKADKGERSCNICGRPQYSIMRRFWKVAEEYQRGVFFNLNTLNKLSDGNTVVLIRPTVFRITYGS